MRAAALFGEAKMLRVQLMAIKSESELHWENDFSFLDDCRLPLLLQAFRRAKIAGFFATAVHDNFLQYNSGVNHPDLQRVFANVLQVKIGGRLADIVGGGLLPF